MVVMQTYHSGSLYSESESLKATISIYGRDGTCTFTPNLCVYVQVITFNAVKA